MPWKRNEENARHERETGVGIPLAYNEKKLYKILQFPLYLAVGRDQRTAHNVDIWPFHYNKETPINAGRCYGCIRVS